MAVCRYAWNRNLGWEQLGEHFFSAERRFFVGRGHRNSGGRPRIRRISSRNKGHEAAEGDLFPDPKFPDLPEGAEERGTVVMLIGINVKGRVQEVRVLRSDEAAFDKAAVETVKKWKFRSAMKDGHSVPVQVTVEMKFAR